MLDFSRVQNYYIACGNTDMRKQIDSLAALVQRKDLQLFAENSTNKSGRLKSFCWFCDAFHFTEGQNTDLDYGKRLRKYAMNIHS